MRKILFVLAVLAFTVVAPVYADDNVSGINVSGTWALTQISNMGGGEDNWDVVITQDGENLNVAATSSEFPMTLPGTGTLKGNKVKFSLKGPGGQIQIDYIYEGKVTGKKMEGTYWFQDDSGNTITFEPFLPNGGRGKPAVDEIENSNTWSAVMK